MKECSYSLSERRDTYHTQSGAEITYVESRTTTMRLHNAQITITHMHILCACKIRSVNLRMSQFGIKIAMLHNPTRHRIPNLVCGYVNLSSDPLPQFPLMLSPLSDLFKQNGNEWQKTKIF
jgi:hypothetical protein